MQMLGRENISSPDIAVMELVKNAYDADAQRVELIFDNSSESSGEIKIIDDGSGMDLDALVNNWMVISTDNKVNSPNTAKFGRRKVGEKGIGRLAMDRLAEHAVIVTHKKRQSGFKLIIDWSKYNDEKGYLHDIKHPLEEVPQRNEDTSGTTIHLSKLRDKWTSNDYDALHSNLSLLIPPFDHDVNNFTIYFKCPDSPKLSGEISNPIAEAAEYRLKSELTENNIIHHRLIHRSGHVTEYQREWQEVLGQQVAQKPACGPLQFDLRFYLSDSQKLREANIKAGELRQFLKNYQGIRIYRDNFRVKPYGDPEGDKDWLGLNRRFASSTRTFSGSSTASTWRVSERQVVGAVLITRDKNPDLMDQTNREGMVENSAYQHMKSFLLHSVQYMERERQKRVRIEIENQGRMIQNISIEEELSSSQDELVEISTQLNAIAATAKGFDLMHIDIEPLKEIARSIERVAKDKISPSRVAYDEHLQEIELRQTENQLLIGLSTLGIAMTAFGHEIGRVINNVKSRASLLSKEVKNISFDNKDVVENDLEVLMDSANQVASWGRFALDRVRQDKRTRKNIDLSKLVKGIVEEFEDVFNRTNIKVQTDIQPDLPPLKAYGMDIEAIVINFITNANEALLTKTLEHRQLALSLTYDVTTSQYLLECSDSGNGISQQDIDDIFTPLFSTRQDKHGNPIGTGMGLTIVQNIVNSYNGRIEVDGHGELGGASFRVYLPNKYAQRNAQHG